MTIEKLLQNPLKLTEEWLILYGFDVKEDDSLDYRVIYFKQDEDFCFKLTYDLLQKSFWMIAPGQKEKIETLDQLHHIYFTLTGKELQ